MSARAENQGIRVVGDFTCKAIPVTGKAKRVAKSQEITAKKNKKRKRKDS